MKFQVYQSFWGMTSLPYGSDEEWSIEEKLEKIAAAGFDGVEFDFESMSAEKVAETNSSFDYG